MKKLIVISVLCALFATSCSSSDKVKVEKVKDIIVTEIPTQEATQNKSDEVWEEKIEDSELNSENIEYTDADNSKAFPEDIDQREDSLAKKVQGDFVAVNYKHKDIPNGLIVLAEEALFDDDINQLTFNTLSYEISIGDFYDTFEPDHYTSKEEFETYASHIYKYQLDHNTYYLEVSNPCGSGRFVHITIYKEVDGELTLFDCWDCFDDDARIIEYKGALYFIESSYNYNTKFTDTIDIFRLVPEVIEEYVRIELQTKQFEWEEFYNNHQSYEKSISSYVDSIKSDLMDKSPISDSIQVYLGDETNQFDKDKQLKLKSMGSDYDYYEIDFNNDDEPEYIERCHLIPDNYLTLFLSSKLYKFTDERTISINGDFDREDSTLMQLWFKEIEGKVFTFRLFLRDGYNYCLNVSLVEDTNVTQVQSYLIAPKKEFNFSIQVPPTY